jgi:signal transduction histidine kinase
MKQPNKMQAVSAAGLTAARRRLQRETVRRKAAEDELKDSRQHYGQLLEQSLLMQSRLRYLSHRILLAQEEERKYISRELHDEISQILTGINVRLATLKIEAAANNGNLNRKIATTQRLVEKSVAAVHRFARELRPAMLDDLGLVPALLAFMKEFGKRTGIRIHFASGTTGKIGQLDSIKRTVLYRVAQEALTNVDKHAHANRIKVLLQSEANVIRMEISDDGTSFNVERELNARRRKRLGIIGMRERVEMVGGEFSIESTPDRGTTVRVKIPLGNGEKPEEASSDAQN